MKFTFLANLIRFIGINKGVLSAVGACMALVAAFLLFFYSPPAAWIGPKQPIAFSHRIHAGVKQIDCWFCHPYVNRSAFPGLPQVGKCLYCHNYIITKHPEIQKEHRYFDEGMPTPWVKVNYLPEHVFFKHERHIKKDIACQECHGPVETLDRLPTNRFQMGFCLDCHRTKQANVGCWLACHN